MTLTIKKLPITLATLLLAVLAAGAQPALASQRSTVKVVNQSSQTVVAIHSSPRYRNVYGRTDLMGNALLRPGYQMDVDFESDDAENECVQDVVVKASNGSVWRRTFDVCRITRWTLND